MRDIIDREITAIRNAIERNAQADRLARLVTKRLDQRLCDAGDLPEATLDARGFSDNMYHALGYGRIGDEKGLVLLSETPEEYTLLRDHPDPQIIHEALKFVPRLLALIGSQIAYDLRDLPDLEEIATGLV